MINDIRIEHDLHNLKIFWETPILLSTLQEIVVLLSGHRVFILICTIHAHLDVHSMSIEREQ